MHENHGGGRGGIIIYKQLYTTSKESFKTAFTPQWKCITYMVSFIFSSQEQDTFFYAKRRFQWIFKKLLT